MFDFNSKQVCCLRKALYRLKQVFQVWYETFTDFLKPLELQHLELDCGIFVLQDQ